jgi:hypothetical protein
MRSRFIKVVPIYKTIKQAWARACSVDVQDNPTTDMRCTHIRGKKYTSSARYETAVANTMQAPFIRERENLQKKKSKKLI